MCDFTLKFTALGLRRVTTKLLERFLIFVSLLKRAFPLLNDVNQPLRETK